MLHQNKKKAEIVDILKRITQLLAMTVMVLNDIIALKKLIVLLHLANGAPAN